MSKQNNFLDKRITRKMGNFIYIVEEDFYKDKDDDSLLNAIAFLLIPKLGMYEDIGTVEECKEAMSFWKAAKELAGRGL